MKTFANYRKNRRLRTRLVHLITQQDRALQALRVTGSGGRDNTIRERMAVPRLIFYGCSVVWM